MGAFEDMIARIKPGDIPEVETVPLTLKGAPVKDQHYADPDTVVLDKQPYRLGGGFNAPETAHIKGGIFVPGERMGGDTAQQEALVQRAMGYTDVQPTGETDKYGRKIANIVNPNRTPDNNLSDTMIQIGAAPITSRTPMQSLNKMVSMRAAVGLFGNESQDPLVQQAIKNFNKPVEAIPKMLMTSESDYAGAKRMVGVGAAAEAVKEVERLDGILKDTTLRPDLRDSLSKQRDEAKQQIWIASTTPDFAGGVLNRQSDRYLDNRAKDQMTTAFMGNLADIATGVGGILQMSGEAAGWDWLAKRAAAGVRQNKLEQGLKPSYLADFQDIGTDTVWNTISDTTQYLGNLFAGSLPTMAATIAASAATGGMGPVAGFAMGSLPGSVIYTGQYYANQPDDKKNPLLAIAMGVPSAALEKLGMDAMLFKSNPLSVVGRKEIIDAIVKKKNVPEAVAEKMFADATKAELTSFAKSGAEFAKQQFMTNEAFARGLGSLAIAGGTEAGTETLQQYAQMVAEKGMWNNDAIYDREFSNQMLNAAVGGGAMGSVMHGASQAHDAAQWHSLANSYEEYTQGLRETQMYQAHNMSKGADAIQSIRHGAEKTSNDIAKAGAPEDLMSMASHKGVWNGVKAILTDPGRLLRQLGHTIAPSIIDDSGNFRENMALIKAIIGGYGLLPGDHMLGDKQRTMGKWGGNQQDNLANTLKTDRATVNKLIRDAYHNVWEAGGRLPDTPTNRVLQDWKDNQDAIINDMKVMAAKAGVTVDELTNANALFESSAIDPVAMRKSKQDVIDILLAQGETLFRANKAFEGLLASNKQVAQRSRDYLASKGVFSDPRLSHLFETNMFDSMENLKDRVSSAISHKVYLGEKGSNLAHLLKKAWEAGEFGDDIDAYKDAVKNVQDWYEIETGTYHTLDKYPKLKSVLMWGTTLTMMASLAKAAISSQTEVAMSMLGTPAEAISKQLGTYVKEFFKEYRSDINKMNSASLAWTGISSLKARRVPNHEADYARIDTLEKELGTGNVSVERAEAIQKEIEKLHEKVLARSLFERLGYNETGFNTQSKFEYSANNPRNAMQVFASVIGLRAQTDSTRIAVLSVASDIVLAKIASLRMIPKELFNEAILTGRHMTNEQAQSLMELQSYGMDVRSVIEYLNAFDDKQIRGVVMNAMDPKSSSSDVDFQNMLMTTLGNLVDSRVVNPQSHNMPKYYNDPRLRIVTAMGRFMATAHATILPRLYKTYMLEGNVGMRYEAFRTMAMALLFASLANMLKDELSYGGDNPYIKDKRKKAQRTLNSSGLIGQYEKVLDAITPLYPSRGPDASKNPVGWAANKAVEMSPQLSWAKKVGTGVYDVANGNTPEGVKNLVRAAPVVGSFPISANKAAELFK